MENRRKSDGQFLAMAAPVLTVISGITSLYSMGLAGQRQQSIILIAAFTFWVAAPFLGLLIINRSAASWMPRQKLLFQWLMIILAISSMIVYALRLRPQNAKPAFTFLVFPFVSLVIIIAFLFVFRRLLFKK